MSEQIVVFGDTRTLVGVLHTAEAAAARRDVPTVVMLNAGILHRVGPNRLYVKLARQLERAGFNVFRFDVWGIGDSQDRNGDVDNKTFVDDTLEAFDMLRERLGAERFILMGVCMGAQIALEVAHRDARAQSLVLMEGIYVKSARYYVSRVLDPHKWKRVVTGESHFVRKLRSRVLGPAPKPSPQVTTNGTHGANGTNKSLTSFLASNRDKNMKDKLHQLLDRGAKIMLIFRDGNEIAYNYRLRREGDDIYAVGLPKGLEVAFVKFADHTFTPVLSQELLAKTTLKWVTATHGLAASASA